MATTQADLVARLNAIYAMLDQMVLDGEGEPSHLEELARKRDATRAAIDTLIQRGLAANAARLESASADLFKLSAKMYEQAATVVKVKTAIDIAGQVIAIAAEITAAVI